jgi:O-antigen ligase
MNFAAGRVRGEIAAGAALGMLAALIALTPSLTAKASLCAAPLGILALWWMLHAPGRWLALFFVSALLLPPLPIDLGNAGPHVALLFAGVGVLIGLIYRIPILTDRLSASLCALFAAMMASVAMAAIYSGLPIAAASMARVMLFGISVYVFFFVRGAQISVNIVRLLFWAAVGSAVFACLDFYYQFPAPAGYGPQFIWLESGVFRRAQGFFYEASTLGNLCAFFLEMIAVALFRPRQERPVSLPSMLAGGVALASALVLSYSRASLVNLAVALAVLLWLHRKRVRLARFLIAAGILAGAAFASLSFIFPIFARAYWQRIGASFSYFSEAPNAILSGRVDTWTLLTRYLIAHPWHAILGIGYKTLPYSDFIGQTSVADNTYLGLLIETGIAGFTALLVWNFFVLRASYRASQSEDSGRSFCGTWMLCFWAGQIVQMFSGDLLTYWRVLPVYTCVLALAVRRR